MTSFVTLSVTYIEAEMWVKSVNDKISIANLKTEKIWGLGVDFILCQVVAMDHCCLCDPTN